MPRTFAIKSNASPKRLLTQKCCINSVKAEKTIAKITPIENAFICPFNGMVKKNTKSAYIPKCANLSNAEKSGSFTLSNGLKLKKQMAIIHTIKGSQLINFCLGNFFFVGIR